MVIYAFRNALTAPSLPAGWTSINTSSTGATSYRIGYRVATSNAETSGTWTNASQVCVVVYRDVATNKTPVGSPVEATATSTVVSYPQLVVAVSSWVVAFAANLSFVSTIETPPTGLSLLQDNADVVSTSELVAFDSNGSRFDTGRFPALTVDNGQNVEWRSQLVEIRAEYTNLPNAQRWQGGGSIAL